MILSKAGESYLIKKCWKISRKVFQILTYIGQERPNDRYRNTVKDLLLPNTVNPARRMKDRIPQGWIIPQYRPLKSKLPKYTVWKKAQYRKPTCPPRLEKSMSKSGTDW